MNAKERIIVGIESSCDDTGVAIVSSDGRILGESIAHQHEVHAQWGGVVPTLAMEAHREAIDRVFNEAMNQVRSENMKDADCNSLPCELRTQPTHASFDRLYPSPIQQASLTPRDLDAVAVTIGPGLSLCLRVGVLKARQIAVEASRPLVPIHHMEAHALVARLTAGGGLSPANPVQFPFLCLLVSGGHNMLLLVRGVGDYEILGTTLDDALGEAYDKVARLLALPLIPSGGAVLEALATEGDAARHKFTLPLLQRPTADFSFSGLKTAVRVAIETEMPWLAAEAAPEAVAAGQQMPEDQQRRRKADIAASFQKTAVDHLVGKLRRGIAWGLESEPTCRQFVVAGGVAANQYIRGRLGVLTEELGLQLVVPPPRYCTDNGVMVAWGGVERFHLGLITPPPATILPVEGEWVDLKPRWPLGPRDARAMLTGASMRSTKKRDLHVDLTALTRAELAAVRDRSSSVSATPEPVL